jgi:hypothetical protein
LGASSAARAKWRQRGVPAIWQIKIVSDLAAAGRRVELTEFDGLARSSGEITGAGHEAALCTVCDHRLDDVGIRACSISDCPHAVKDAA